MPPLSEWRGDLKMTGEHGPHDTLWRAYIDGEFAAEALTRTEVEARLIELLSAT